MDDLDAGSDRYRSESRRCKQKESEMHDTFTERYIDEPDLPNRELEGYAKSYEAFHGYPPYLV